MNSSINELRLTVYASLMAALIAVGAYLSIPIGPVPIVLQNLFVMLAGLLLGPYWGLASVAVYLLAGACGLPVFAGGLGGIGRFAGPTGGYLIGYLPAVFITGLISHAGRRRIWIDALAALIGTLIVYASGVSWLKVVTGLTWGKTLMVGMIPFLIGDAFKIAAAALSTKALRPMLDRNSRIRGFQGSSAGEKPRV